MKKSLYYNSVYSCNFCFYLRSVSVLQSFAVHFTSSKRPKTIGGGLKSLRGRSVLFVAFQSYVVLCGGSRKLQTV